MRKNHERPPSPRQVRAGRPRVIGVIAADLAHALDDLRGVYEEVLAALAAQRRAVTAADSSALEASTRAMTVLDRRLREIESARKELTEQAIVAGAPGASVPAIARAIEGPASRTLVESAAKLRDCLERVQREQDILRRAIEGVLGHIQGLWNHVGRSLDQTGTYASGPRTGAAIPGGMAIDLTR
jgi:FlgN protein